MFVTPMISVYPSDFERRQKQLKLHRQSTSSSGSSDASSLHRTNSTNSHGSSNGSNSRWSTSSVSSAEVNVAPTKHRKRSSRVSFNLPRPLQPFHKKGQSQPVAQIPQTPRSQPPPRPQRPEEGFQFPPRPNLSTDVPRPLEIRKSADTKKPAATGRPAEKLRKRSDSAPIQTATPPSPGAEWQCSDLVVRCKTDVYHVDRTIMCYHSKWFARICAIMTNPKTSKSVIDLSADDPEAVAAMMQYCYQLNYTDKSVDPDCAVDEVPELRPHVDVYMLAERYGMAGLKRLALEKFEELATTVLKISGDEEHFLQAVRAMYAPTRRANADEMRQAAVQICANHVQDFISGSSTTMAMVFESMDSLPEFRTELLEEMALRWQ